jgi:hypothetical protein
MPHTPAPHHRVDGARCSAFPNPSRPNSRCEDHKRHDHCGSDIWIIGGARRRAYDHIISSPSARRNGRSMETPYGPSGVPPTAGSVVVAIRRMSVRCCLWQAVANPWRDHCNCQICQPWLVRSLGRRTRRDHPFARRVKTRKGPSLSDCIAPTRRWKRLSTRPISLELY